MGYQDIGQSKRRVHHRTSAAKSSGAASQSVKRPRRKSGEGACIYLEFLMEVTDLRQSRRNCQQWEDRIPK